MGKIFIFLLLVACATATYQAPRAVTRLGVAIGTTMNAIPTGRAFYAFRSIPYAQKPLGDLRFKAPQPLTSWPHDIDATKDAPLCIQKDFLVANPIVVGQEDCLYLNIYTPMLPEENIYTEKLLPIMVYIYGGGFFSGTSSSSVHGPEYLLAKDIVLVTFNYRVGAMGFFSSGTSLVPGNAGLKDQVEVLKWIQQNAHAFGGDPTCVTLFGESAGSASVHYHMLSPMSTGLFQRAILQSGTSLSVWSWGTTPVEAQFIAKMQANFLNCTTESETEMISCLKSVDAEQLVDSASMFQVWDRDPFVIYTPVIEVTTNSINEEDHFITDSPFNLIQKGHVHNVPIMVGVVAFEGTVRAGAIFSKEKLIEDFNSRPEELGPFLMGLVRSVGNDPTMQQEIWRNISSFYFDDKNITKENEEAFINLYSDRLFIHSIHRTAVLHSSLNPAPVFLYKFSHEGLHSFTPIYSHNDSVYHGAGHTDDLIYLFRSPQLFADWPEGHPDLIVRDLMVELWTNFAYFGTPTPSAFNGPIWHPLDVCEPLHYAEITTAFSTNNADFFEERVNFWDSQNLNENSQYKQILLDLPVRTNCNDASTVVAVYFFDYN